MKIVCVSLASMVFVLYIIIIIIYQQQNVWYHWDYMRYYKVNLSTEAYGCGVIVLGFKKEQIINQKKIIHTFTINLN